MLEIGGSAILLDLGQGSLGSLFPYRDPASLEAVVVSHMHGDHVGGLIGLIGIGMGASFELGLVDVDGYGDPFAPGWASEDVPPAVFLGDLVAGQCYWNMGALWIERAAMNWANRIVKNWSDMEWQVRNWLFTGGVWGQSAGFGLTGNWIMRAIIEPQ